MKPSLFQTNGLSKLSISKQKWRWVIISGGYAGKQIFITAVQKQTAVTD